MKFYAYAPRNGDTVHLRGDNRWQLAAGRYVLREALPGGFNLEGERSEKVQAVCLADLQAEEARGPLTPIPAAEIERDRRAVQLLGIAPMRGQRGCRGRAAAPQQGTADLPMFGAARLL